MIDPVEAPKLTAVIGDVDIHKYTFCSAASTERLLYNGAPEIPVIQFKVPFGFTVFDSVQFPPLSRPPANLEESRSLEKISTKNLM